MARAKVRHRKKGPGTLPTVWQSWLPDPDGPTMTALRHCLEVMDRATASPTYGTELAASWFDVYNAATAERVAQAEGRD